MAFWLSLLVLAFTTVVVADAFLGLRRMGKLADVDPDVPENLPRLSVIIPARNEAGTIEPALRSILAQDYSALEVVAIDDRSEDTTGAILDRVAADSGVLQVVHVRELPPGWLGKNHALHLGASSARGEYFLFSDADVHYEQGALRRAVAFCDARRLDHLTILPDLPLRSPLLQCGSLGGILGLLMLYRPWRARASGRHGMGIGAFNLVRAEAYRRAGGHAAIRMEVVDDIELGRLMGEHGRQDMLFGTGMVSVEIYRTLAEMLHGLQKNAFAFLRFSPWLLVAGTLLTAALQWPWLGILVTDGPTRWINAATVVLIVGIHAWLAKRFGYGLGCLVFLPGNGLGSIALSWQVAIATWVRGGIVWRGTLYPLGDLKRGRRR